ncbi:MAG: hypothetical protein N5P05_003875 [Chroococcopsis gigantea SAG 12.99]|jgi:N-acetylmuramoyl-L-alanine amidase|nr:N-acetylmuramoyl-L-alanine amidase [Chlorogloea purpurea SAG 13.99]MDV3002269.1 hypothetical protein [Chroococcopsis gigantea SAG 12.99]
MWKIYPWIGLISFSIVTGQVYTVKAQSSLKIVYPPNNHQTIADSIFLIGSAHPYQELRINNQRVKLSKKGYFAPSLPLQLGDNLFTISQNGQKLTLKITRRSNTVNPPQSLGFINSSLSPNMGITRLKGELVCFSAISFPTADVRVQIGSHTMSLLPQSFSYQLPPNSAVLTGQNQGNIDKTTGLFRGCKRFRTIGNLGTPIFTASLNDRTVTQKTSGSLEIIDSDNLPVVEIIVDSGVTRTGPGADYSRLTPLPKGTRTRITGREGEWLRLDYGAWILERETRLLPGQVIDKSIVRGISSRSLKDATEIIFPLQYPVPIAVRQEDDKFILTLYNTAAQTDTIALEDNPLIRRLDWRQIEADKIEYTFHLFKSQQWGYDLKYQGANLILTLRHPPQISNSPSQPLKGIKILLDPGHGGKESGSLGPTGYPEKSVNLLVSQLLKKELTKRGAEVYLTRNTDTDLSLQARVEKINQFKPNLSLSVHYNALPDGGDAMNTKGIGTFWYHPQAHDLALFLHDYLVKKLDRPSYGVFWNNLALTRPQIAPSVLLELGFMINPDEFEWITNGGAQKKLAEAIADGVVAWILRQ